MNPIPSNSTNLLFSKESVLECFCFFINLYYICDRYIVFYIASLWMQQVV